jgi:hypothetical protein
MPHFLLVTSEVLASLRSTGLFIVTVYQEVQEPVSASRASNGAPFIDKSPTARFP